MSGALVAFLFAWVEFARTAVGLWQLHVFRHWVVASIRSLESLGYVVGESRADNVVEKSDTENSDEKGDRAGVCGPRNLFRIADSLIINDMVVDNRLSEGDIQCTLRLRESPSKKSWKQRMRRWAHWLFCIWYFPRLVLAICRSKEPLFSSPSSVVYFMPYNAEDVWMR